MSDDPTDVPAAEETVQEDSTIVVEETNVLSMSDEDFMKEPAPEPEAEVIAEPDDNTELVVDESTDDDNDNVEPNTDLDKEIVTPPESTDKPVEDDKPIKTELDNVPENDEPAETENDSTVKDEDKLTGFDKIMAPFKANGREMQMQSVDDVINLMQMGANYHKKMTALRPSLKTLKLLEKNDLLDQEKLGYLIDLHNHNPDAITKLMKDSKLDPLDIDVKGESNYTPQTQTVSDSEITLDSVLDSIQDTPTYERTLNVLTTEWDTQSKGAITADPQIISVINEQMQNGIYDKIVSAIEYERSLGRLVGVSDIEAYHHVGETLNRQGMFNNKQSNQEQEPNIPAQVKPTKPPVSDVERKKRKEAVSPTKAKPVKTSAKTYNPLTMSDEDFLKFEQTQLKRA